jgi:hypothetical protein
MSFEFPEQNWKPIKLNECSYLAADRGETNNCFTLPTVETPSCSAMRSLCVKKLKTNNFYFTDNICSNDIDGEYLGEPLKNVMYACCSSAKTVSFHSDAEIPSRNFVSSELFDWALANTTAMLSAQAYCDSTLYLSQNFSSYASNFIPTFRIFSPEHDLNGYIGYRAYDQSIYVVFRGSTSMKNFVDDMNFFQTPYPYCAECSVHRGFFAANNAVIKDIIYEVQRLNNLFPSFSIVVTGHSLGAAVATLCAIDLIETGLKNVKLVNFGSPRVGDIETAAYISDRLVDKFRITNHKDLIPHLPLFEKFTHISGEWYQDETGLHPCEGFEDTRCSYQWYLTSLSDHMSYLGVSMGIAGCLLDDEMLESGTSRDVV